MNKNNIIYLVVALLAAITLVFVFSGRKTADKLEGNNSDFSSNNVIQENQSEIRDLNLIDGRYSLLLDESQIVWEGRKPLISNYSNKGVIRLKSGEILVNQTLILEGEIVIDMHSLETTEVFKGSIEGLTGHLKSEDFFDVINYSEASIKMLGVLPETEKEKGLYYLATEITIKGISNNVNVPVEIYMEDGKIVMLGKVELDRTLWDIRFGSSKFFENLTDNMIDDMFGVEFRLVGLPY